MSSFSASGIGLLGKEEAMVSAYDVGSSMCRSADSHWHAFPQCFVSSLAPSLVLLRKGHIVDAQMCPHLWPRQIKKSFVNALWPAVVWLRRGGRNPFIAWPCFSKPVVV